LSIFIDVVTGIVPPEGAVGWLRVSVQVVPVDM
jgi:hypothetical protein